MFQAVMSDYSVNTLLYSLWQDGVLSKTVAVDHVSLKFHAKNRVDNISCTSLNNIMF